MPEKKKKTVRKKHISVKENTAKRVRHNYELKSVLIARYGTADTWKHD